MSEGQGIYDTMRHLAQHSTDFAEMCLVFFTTYPRFKQKDLHDNVMVYMREQWEVQSKTRRKNRPDTL